VIRDGGWVRYSIWEHSAVVRDLYARRCRLEVEEMTCHAQAAEMLSRHVRPGETLLDVGCGSGYFFHSLKTRSIPVEYWGMDASQTLLDFGRRHLPAFGLPAERLLHLRLEDLDGEADHVVCVNVLSNIDNYHKPLERMLRVARKSLLLRESLAPRQSYAYVRDEFLDPGCDLRVHVNTYRLAEVLAFIGEHGFHAHAVTDRRTGGVPEMVIGHPHHWTFIEAKRK
jgi:ubiquinone/menaquinone biosynthesis C-methylase UbiE